jgi:hypothetical protein
MRAVRGPSGNDFTARAPGGGLFALLVATVAAGTLSTLVQVVLWIAFTDAWPAILFRDARLAAALVLGPSVLPPPASFDPGVMAVATLVHFALSLVYTAFVARLVERRTPGTAAAIGAAFGLVLYAVNLHGFTLVFPWFAQARDWIAMAAHVAFGVAAALTWIGVRPRRVA